MRASGGRPSKYKAVEEFIAFLFFLGVILAGDIVTDVVNRERAEVATALQPEAAQEAVQARACPPR